MNDVDSSQPRHGNSHFRFADCVHVGTDNGNIKLIFCEAGSGDGFVAEIRVDLLGTIHLIGQSQRDGTRKS